MSKSSSSCFGSFLLLVVSLVLIRFLLPPVWKILAGIFAGTFYAGIILLFIGIALLGYFTVRNFQKNKLKEEQKTIAPVSRAEALYQSVVQRLQQDLVLNQVSADEFLQSEILISEKLQESKKDLIRLKDFASSKNEKMILQQIRDYQQQLRETSDPAVKEVVQENLKMLDEKKLRISSVKEEIRQKEASVDLIYNSLSRVEEDMKFGRAITHLFPRELYARFGLTPPSDQERIRPLDERSSDG